MADYYGSVTGADAYHAARGNTAWTGSDEAKAAALIRASVWLDGAYGDRYPGTRTGGRAQPLGWPRKHAVDCDHNEIDPETVPYEIENAAYEAALRELAAPGSLSPDYVRADGVKSEQVGSLSVHYRDGTGTAADVIPIVTAVDSILASLIGRRTATSSGWISRA